MHATARRERTRDLRAKHREPAQAQKKLRGIGQAERRLDLQRLDVDVGLVEAIEQHEATRAHLFDFLREVRQRRKNGESLIATGMPTLSQTAPRI